MTADEFKEVNCITFRRERGLNDSNVEKGVFWEALSRVLALEELSKVFEFLANTTFLLPSDELLLSIRRMNADFPCTLTVLRLVENVQHPFTPRDSKKEHAFRVVGKSEGEIEQAVRTVFAADDRVDGVVRRQVATSEGGKSRELCWAPREHRSDCGCVMLLIISTSTITI